MSPSRQRAKSPEDRRSPDPKKLKKDENGQNGHNGLNMNGLRRTPPKEQANKDSVCIFLSI